MSTSQRMTPPKAITQRQGDEQIGLTSRFATATCGDARPSHGRRMRSRRRPATRRAGSGCPAPSRTVAIAPDWRRGHVQVRPQQAAWLMPLARSSRASSPMSALSSVSGSARTVRAPRGTRYAGFAAVVGVGVEDFLALSAPRTRPDSFQAYVSRTRTRQLGAVRRHEARRRADVGPASFLVASRGAPEDGGASPARRCRPSRRDACSRRSARTRSTAHDAQAEAASMVITPQRRSSAARQPAAAAPSSTPAPAGRLQLGATARGSRTGADRAAPGTSTRRVDEGRSAAGSLRAPRARVWRRAPVSAHRERRMFDDDTLLNDRRKPCQHQHAELHGQDAR